MTGLADDVLSLEESLSDAGFAALRATDFKRGQVLFAHLYGLAVRTQEVLLGLAICAGQNGDDDTAGRMLAEATVLALHGQGPSPELYEAIRPWLPGGPLSRSSSKELGAARRFVARGPADRRHAEHDPRYT